MILVSGVIQRCEDTKPSALYLQTSTGLGNSQGEFTETWIKHSSLCLKIFLD